MAPSPSAFLRQASRWAGIEYPSGLSGERLVASVLDPNGSDRIALPSDGFLGELTSGERSGFHHLVRGAFLLIRNATAHRPIAYTQSEAEDIVHLVNVCLRLLP